MHAGKKRHGEKSRDKERVANRKKNVAKEKIGEKLKWKCKYIWHLLGYRKDSRTCERVGPGSRTAAMYHVISVRDRFFCNPGVR